MPLLYQTGLEVWLEADTITGLVSDDPLTDGDWVDDSPNAHSTTVVETPIYQDGSVDGPNLLPYVQVGRTAHGRGKVRIPTAYNDGLTAAEIFMVLRKATGTPVAFEEHGPASTFGGGLNNYPSGAGLVRLAWASNATKVNTTTGALSQDIEVWHILNMGSSGSRWFARIGDELVLDTGTNTFSMPNRTTGDQSDFSAETGCWKGAISAILIFDHILADADRQTVLEYLSPKYGIFGPSVITGVADSTTQVTLTITPAGGATDHEIYASTDPAFTPGPSNLLAGSLGAAPTPYVWTGRVAGTEYFILVRNDNGTTSFDSAKIKVATPGVDIAPDLRLSSIAATSATFTVGQVPGYLEVRYQRALATDPDFFAPQNNAQDTSAGRYVRTESGLTTSVDYLERAQARYAGGWTDWTDGLAFTPATPVPPTVLPGGNIFTEPKFMEPVPGIAGVVLVSLAWFTGLGAPTLLEWSPVYSASWTTVTSNAALLAGGSYQWDVTAIATGTLVRVRITIGATVYEHPGFLIDKTGTEASLYFREMPQSFDGFSPLLDTTAKWAFARFADPVCPGYGGPTPQVQGVWGQLDDNDLHALVPTTLTPITSRHARVSATGAIFTGLAPGLLPWERFYGAEHAKFGVGVALHGTAASGNQTYVAAYVQHNQLAHHTNGCPGGTDPNGVFVLNISKSSPPVSYTFNSAPISVAASFRAAQCGGQCYERIHPYHVALEIEQTDPGGTPNEFHIRAWLGAPYSVLIDQLIEIEDTGGNPVTLECGFAGIISAHQVFTQRAISGYWWRQIYNFGVWNDDTGCDPPDELDEEIIPIPFPVHVPCVVKMTFFEDDRATERFTVATSPLVGLPYLVQPGDGDYSPQTVDFLNGAATLGEFTGRIADAPQIVSPIIDQDSGYMTEKMADSQKRGAIYNGRVQVTLFGDEDVSGFVAADGDAGAPTLNTYASYEINVRDTRERERKTPAFQRGLTTCLMPRGVLFPDGRDAYGYLPGIAGQGAIPNVLHSPLVARCFHDFPSGPVGYRTNRPHVRLDFFSAPDNWENSDTVENRRLIILPYAEKASEGEVEATFPTTLPNSAQGARIRFRFPNIVIWWRVHGLSEPNPWYRIKPRVDLLVGRAPYVIPNVMHIIDATYLLDEPFVYNWHSFSVTFPATPVDVRAVRSITLCPIRAGDTPQIPGGGQLVDVLVQYVGETSDDFPYHYCDLLGNYIEDGALGEFSPRLPTPGLSVFDQYWYWDDGVPIPTGIEYDATQLALMTENVLLRQTEPVKDLREFNEKAGYMPSGWAPCIDRAGRLSPLHRAPPADFAATPLVNNAVVKPDTGWRAGETIINVIDATYRRLFAEPTNAEGVPTGAGDAIEVQEVTLKWIWADGAPVVVTTTEPLARISQSIDKHGVRAIEFDAKLFSIDEFADIPFTVDQEEPYLMIQEQANLILPRYSWGTPVVNLETRSTALAGKRAGDWVRLQVSWMPEFQTQRRGLSRRAQIISLNPINCKWFGATYELDAWLEEIASSANALESGVGFSFGESAYTEVANISSAVGFSFGEAVYTVEELFAAESGNGFSFGEAVYTSDAVPPEEEEEEFGIYDGGPYNYPQYA